MITIDDGPDPYSRQAVADMYVEEGYDVTLYPAEKDCPSGMWSPPPFALAQLDEDTILIYIITRVELEGRDDLIEIVKDAETRAHVRVDVQFIRPGDDLVPTSEVARVANSTLRKARHLFMRGRKRKGFFLLANEIQRLLQFHISGDEGDLTWADLAEQIPLDNTKSLKALLRAIILSPVSNDEELDDLASDFDRLESLYAALLRYEQEPSEQFAKEAATT